MPVSGDLLPRAQPDLVMRLHVIQEALQRPESSGPAYQSAVEANIQKLGLRFTLGIQHIKGVAKVGEELVAAVEALCSGEAHVVAVQRVGDDQVMARG